MNYYIFKEFIINLMKAIKGLGRVFKGKAEFDVKIRPKSLRVLNNSQPMSIKVQLVRDRKAPQETSIVRISRSMNKNDMKTADIEQDFTIPCNFSISKQGVPDSKFCTLKVLKEDNVMIASKNIDLARHFGD